MMDARRMELITQTIAEEVNMAVTRQQGDLLNSLYTMIDSSHSNFKQNIQQILNSQLKRIDENLNEHCVFERKATKKQYIHEARLPPKLGFLFCFFFGFFWVFSNFLSKSYMNPNFKDSIVKRVQILNKNRLISVFIFIKVYLSF